jgi:hypothetical protein
MRSLLALLLLLPSIVLGQSWVIVELQTDQYALETSWVIVQDEEVIEESSTYASNSYNEQLVFLSPGNYEFIIYDSFGDGICCGFGEGWFALSNSCQLDTAVYDFNGPELILPFEVLPCPPPIFGCTDPTGVDYNPWATVSLPCTYPPQPCEEGETTVIITVTPDTYAGEISWSLESNGVEVLAGDDYSVVGLPITHDVCATVGDSLVLEVYDMFGDGMCGSCYGGVDGNISMTTLCGDTLYYIGDTLQYSTISSEPIAVDACTTDVLEGCTDPNFTEYNPLADIDDESCLTEVILGCTDSTAVNFNPDANTLETQPLCMTLLTITDGAGDGWFGSWLGVVQGDEIFGPFQMGPNDGTEEQFLIPLYSGEPIEVMFFTGGNAETTAAQCGFFFTSPTGIFMEAGSNPWTDAIKKFPFKYEGVPYCQDFCVDAVVGCMNPIACDYNPDANVESDCTLPIEFYTCDNQCVTDLDNDGVCDELEIVGCMDATAFNYNPIATDSGDCEQIVFGCTDPTQFNYNAEANTDNGSCVAFIYGCTNPDAINYDEEANADGGGCIDVLEGCMDTDAYNFNADANTADNEQCLYDAGCVGEPGDPYWGNDQCYSWVISIDPYCCETSWDNVCVEMYEYCGDGVTNIPELSERISIYPNPTSRTINIQAPPSSVSTIYNSIGQQLVTTINSQIELPTAGVYIVVVEYNGRVVKQTIVRE